MDSVDCLETVDCLHCELSNQHSKRQDLGVAKNNALETDRHVLEVCHNNLRRDRRSRAFLITGSKNLVNLVDAVLFADFLGQCYCGIPPASFKLWKMYSRVQTTVESRDQPWKVYPAVSPCFAHE